MLKRTCLSLFGFVLVACGGAEPDSKAGASTPPTDSATSEAASDGEAAPNEVQVKLAGEDAPLNGGALLEVREQNPIVNLVVTAVYEQNHDNLVQFQLALMGVENAMGFHRTELGSPGNSAAYAVAYLEHQSYSSRGGVLEVTLAGDGDISGNLEFELFKDSLPGQLDEAGEPLRLSGNFQGSWSLVCRSPVQALPGDHSVSDSAYCRGLTF